MRYGSPKAQDQSAQEALYALLRSSETLETDRIYTTLLLNQGKQSYSVEKPTGNALQIDDAEGHLRIFLPRNRADRETCYLTKLPRYLLDWVMDYPTIGPRQTFHEALQVVQAVLMGRPPVLLSILEHHGVPQVSVGEIDQYDEEDARDFDSSTSSNLPGINTPSSPAPPLSSSRSVSQSHGYPLRAQSGWQARPYSTYSASLPPTISTQYRGLLEKVIAAGRRADIPSRGLFDMAQMQATLIPDVDATQDFFVLRNPDRLERDKMIGAAGEAFVSPFTPLKHHQWPHADAAINRFWSSLVAKTYQGLVEQTGRALSGIT